MRGHPRLLEQLTVHPTRSMEPQSIRFVGAEDEESATARYLGGSTDTTRESPALSRSQREASPGNPWPRHDAAGAPWLRLRHAAGATAALYKTIDAETIRELGARPTAREAIQGGRDKPPPPPPKRQASKTTTTAGAASGQDMSENERESLSKALRDAHRKLADVQEALESETNEAQAIGAELRLLQVSVCSANLRTSSLS